VSREAAGEKSTGSLFERRTTSPTPKNHASERGRLENRKKKRKPIECSTPDQNKNNKDKGIYNGSGRTVVGRRRKGEARAESGTWGERKRGGGVMREKSDKVIAREECQLKN